MELVKDNHGYILNKFKSKRYVYVILTKNRRFIL